MKKLILALVLVFLVFDGVFVISYLWPRSRSECPLDEASAQPSERLAAKIKFERTEANLDLWNTPEGRIWTVHGEKTLPFLMEEEQRDAYEPPGHEVRRGDIVLDCGANIGMFVRKALSRGAGLVVAIEPAPSTLDALRRNFDAEIRAKRVIVYPKGVWDRDTEMDLTINETNEGGDSVVLGDSGPKVRVPLTTIDKIVAELNLPRVDFIKMDIEGAEKPAIRGAKNTIQRFRPRMSLSSEHFTDDFIAIPALVKSIEPRYSYLGCDCERMPALWWKSLVIAWKWTPLVIAFDPLS
jgi:FkbM family methyltransferase